jgi:hypothetical protein
MRYIYSIIGAIILLISGTQSAFAQKETTITRTILGCTLGVSTVDSVTAMLQKMDADFEAVESTPPRENILFVRRGLTFANTQPTFFFEFFDKKLAMVRVIFYNRDESDRINKNLVAKYKNWIDFSIIGKEGGGTDDSRTMLAHTYATIEDNDKIFKYSLLTYADKALEEKRIKAESADL